MSDGAAAPLGWLESLDAGGRDFLYSHLPQVVVALEWVAAGTEVLAIAVMALGTLRFVGMFAMAELSRIVELRLDGLDRGRLELGRYILAGLELLIVADIIHTALSFALTDLLFLAVLVLIRSVISYSLTREIREIGERLAR